MQREDKRQRIIEGRAQQAVLDAQIEKEKQEREQCGAVLPLADCKMQEETNPWIREETNPWIIESNARKALLDAHLEREKKHREQCEAEARARKAAQLKAMYEY